MSLRRLHPLSSFSPKSSSQSKIFLMLLLIYDNIVVIGKVKGQFGWIMLIFWIGLPYAPLKHQDLYVRQCSID
jgi:hypothetical protein